MLEETTAEGTYFPPKVSRLIRGREASLSLNVVLTVEMVIPVTKIRVELKVIKGIFIIRM